MHIEVTGSLSGAGRYSVEVLIGGVAATGAATSELRQTRRRDDHRRR